MFVKLTLDRDESSDKRRTSQTRWEQFRSLFPEFRWVPKNTYTLFSLTGLPLMGLLVNGTDGVPHYPDSPVNGFPVNGN
jgi:hypothetical protein